MDKHEIPSAGGRWLDGYKHWYKNQPKMLRVVILPFLAAFALLVIKFNALEWKWYFLPAFLLFIGLYNQYLDTVISEGLQNRLDKIRKQSDGWFSKNSAVPRSVGAPNGTFFKKGDSTLAGHLWGRDGRKMMIIDDVDAHLANTESERIFQITHPAQQDYLKSILCYKIEDPYVHECLGIICVDTNIPNTLSPYADYYENVLESFSQRILFETRCAYMKEALSQEGIDR